MKRIGAVILCCLLATLLLGASFGASSDDEKNKNLEKVTNTNTDSRDVKQVKEVSNEAPPTEVKQVGVKKYTRIKLDASKDDAVNEETTDMLISTKSDEVVAKLDNPYHVDLDKVKRLVMAETSGADELNAGLVAMTIRNNMKRYNKYDIDFIRVVCKYAEYADGYNKAVSDVVDKVFLENYDYIDDTPYWFYAPARLTEAPWCVTSHNTRFITETGGHRFYGLKNDIAR